MLAQGCRGFLSGSLKKRTKDNQGPLSNLIVCSQAPTLLQWFMKGSLLMRAWFIRFLLPPRPDFMAVRRTPLSGVAEGGEFLFIAE